MPVNNIKPSSRAKGAIAAVLAVAVGGYVTLFPGQQPVHADTALAIENLVQPWEGRTLRSYLDRIAKPPKWTVCDGDTDDVGPDTVETPQGCNKRVAVKMERDYRKPLVACINGWEARPIGWRAMMLSLSWNIGVAGTCSSTAARLGRAGQYEQSCRAATAFNKVGGRVIVGIVHRREMGDATRIGEAELCVSGL